MMVSVEPLLSRISEGVVGVSGNRSSARDEFRVSIGDDVSSFGIVAESRARRSKQGGIAEKIRARRCSALSVLVRFVELVNSSSSLSSSLKDVPSADQVEEAGIGVGGGRAGSGRSLNEAMSNRMFITGFDDGEEGACS
jgi:hypothetical protein